MEIRLAKVDKKATIPFKAHKSDAGYDMTAVTKNSDEYGNLVYDTKLSIEIPVGYVGLLLPRSSVSKKTLQLSNSCGVLDPGYTGPIIFKFKPTPYYATRDDINHSFDYEPGDKVGQLIVIKTEELEFKEVQNLESTDRGEKGFGSSGN